MELRWRLLRVVFDKQRCVAFLVITGTFTFLGPFGTYEVFDIPMRLAYWTTANAGVALFMAVACDTLFAPDTLDAMPRTAKAILASALGAAGGAGVVWLAETRLRGTSPDPLYIWFCVFVVCLIVISVRLQIWVPSPRPFAKFFKRLPPELGIDLICLSMADHYIDVRTSAGSTMIHMRFADALAELGDYPGMRIHRSHWVADTHAASLIREGSRHVLVLGDGTKLPVSKAHRTGVRAMLDRKHEQRLARIGQTPATNQSAS